MDPPGQASGYHRCRHALCDDRRLQQAGAPLFAQPVAVAANGDEVDTGIFMPVFSNLRLFTHPAKAMNAIDDHPLSMPASVPAPSDKRTRNSPDWNGLAAFLVDLPVPWRPGLAELETFLQAVALHLNRRMKLKSLDERNLRDTLEACPAEIEALGSGKQPNSERSS